MTRQAQHDLVQLNFDPADGGSALNFGNDVIVGGLHVIPQNEFVGGIRGVWPSTNQSHNVGVAQNLHNSNPLPKHHLIALLDRIGIIYYKSFGRTHSEALVVLIEA